MHELRFATCGLVSIVEVFSGYFVLTSFFITVLTNYSTLSDRKYFI
ncbi:22846_t:CDS:2 [Racocetra persica]|uniref:22846_t:CDS:1 n=1 Tax=Racocetra persica TaxID=160502 RepID=A0ACA9KCA6_9GLOM|nr:22846_t:CDS:2 [Racocetra persica]